MKSGNEMELAVIKWSEVRNLNQYDFRFVQLAKVMEEVGELADAMIKGDKEKIIDALGDTNVTLIVLANQLNLLLSECLESAYNEIKDRDGELINGSFIKS